MENQEPEKPEQNEPIVHKMGLGNVVFCTFGCLSLFLFTGWFLSTIAGWILYWLRWWHNMH